jgi:hypothetical protein
VTYYHKLISRFKYLLIINKITREGTNILLRLNVNYIYVCKSEVTFILTLPSFAYIVLVSPEDGPVTGCNMQRLRGDYTILFTIK